MKAESWVLVSELFCAAIELPLAERALYLERSTAEAEVRSEVQRLLALHEGSEDSLAEPGAFLRVSSPAPGTRIGNYRLQRVLGSGGMGTVYEALQDRPQRTVALKTLRHGFSSPSRLQRFLFEAEVLGHLRHPAIAQIYEAGTHTDGGVSFPYFAMELVAGARDLLSYARDEELGLAARLALLVEVCEAVHHGHQKGVIHRDLKAGNILVDVEGRVKVIDFGVARATQDEVPRTAQTLAGQLVGTLATMSPEQLAGDPEQVDARSDVYSLGVVAYELVAGRPPYELENLPLEEVLVRIREVRPPRADGMPQELHWILLRALEKDPARRYASASELAADLRRFCAHQPVSAGPPSGLYLARKFVQRHTLAVAASTAMLALLVAGITGTSWQASEARAGRRAAETQTEVARAVADFLDELLRSADPELARGKELTARELLELASKKIDGAFPDRPAVEAALRTTIGRSYQGLGLYQEAESQLRAALALSRSAFGDDDGRTLEAFNRVTWILYELERFEEAAELGRPTLAACRRLLGDNDARTWSAVNNLAAALTYLRTFDEAERLLLEGLEWMRAGGNPDQPEINDALTNLGFNALEAGRYPQAETYYRQALADCRRQQGDDAPDTLLVITDLANVLVDEDKLKEAEPLLDEVVETSLRVLGPKHRRTVHRRTFRADLWCRQGKLAAAEREYRALIAIDQETPDEAGSFLAPLNGLAMCLRNQGRVAEAAEICRECLEKARRTIGAEHADTMQIQVNLAVYLRTLGERDEARELLEPARERLTSALGHDSPKAVAATIELARLLSDLGEREPARALFEQVIADGSVREENSGFVADARRALEHLRAP